MRQRSLILADRIWRLRLKGMKLVDVAERCCCSPALVSHYTRYVMKSKGFSRTKWRSIALANKRGPKLRYDPSYVYNLSRHNSLRECCELLGLNVCTVRQYIQRYKDDMQKKTY